MNRRELPAQQRAQLAVAVLVDDVNMVVLGEKLFRGMAQRPAAHATIGGFEAVLQAQLAPRLAHGFVASASSHQGHPGLGAILDDRLGQPLAHPGHLLLDPVHVADPVALALAVVGVLVVARSAREIRRLRVPVAGYGAIGDAIAIDVAIAAPITLGSRSMSSSLSTLPRSKSQSG